MPSLLNNILDWSEVWAPLIPLIYLLISKNNKPYLNPIIIFLSLSFAIAIIEDILWKGKNYAFWPFKKGDILWDNNFLYNIQSILRFYLCSIFFLKLNQPFMVWVKKLMPWAFGIFVIFDFIYVENFFKVGSFNSSLLATESAFLLFYCLQYYFYIILDNKPAVLTNCKGFFAVTGLCIYVATCFFVFLFYQYLIEQKQIDNAKLLWNIHNIGMIIFCIFILIQIRKKGDEQ